MEIEDKIALVTGASSGIGLAAAKLLAERGVKLALVSRDRVEIEEIARAIPGAAGFAADLSKEDEAREIFRAALAHFGRIDILINNAGRNYASHICKAKTDLVRSIFELNAFTPLALMQEAHEAMRESGGGAIVNVSSGTVLMAQPIPGMSAYVASKHALTAFSKTAREEFGRSGVIVSTVYPYLTATDFYKNTVNGSRGAGIPSQKGLPAADPPEAVAETVVKAIETGAAELYQHDWMKPSR